MTTLRSWLRHGLSARLLTFGVVSACAVSIATAQPAVTAPPDSGVSDEDAQGDTRADSKVAELGVPAKLDDEEYFELLKLFADTLDQVERNYVEQVSRRELLEAAIQGVLAKLDQYSDYISPDEFDRFRTGVENEFGGIGIRVGMIDGQLTVITPLYGTPAYRAGVRKDDTILRIEDASTESMALEEAIRRMKGPIGSELKIRVKHNDGVEEQFTMSRELVQLETVVGDRRQPDDQWQFLYDAEKKIGYIRIKSFSGQTAEELKQAMQQLDQQEIKALILDLRFNPGGMLTSAIEVSDTFLTDGKKIVSTSGRNVPDRSWSASEEGTFTGFKMAVLVNRYSASASEIVSAALQDHARAKVIGERTWGKGSVQNIIELEGGRSALKLTTASYMRPSGKNIDRLADATDEDDWGVRPDDGFAHRMSTDELRRLVQYHAECELLYPPKAEARNGREPYVDRHIQLALDYFAAP